MINDSTVLDRYGTTEFRRNPPVDCNGTVCPIGVRVGDIATLLPAAHATLHKQLVLKLYGACYDKRLSCIRKGHTLFDPDEESSIEGKTCFEDFKFKWHPTRHVYSVTARAHTTIFCRKFEIDDIVHNDRVGDLAYSSRRLDSLHSTTWRDSRIMCKDVETSIVYTFPPEDVSFAEKLPSYYAHDKDRVYIPNKLLIHLAEMELRRFMPDNLSASLVFKQLCKNGGLRDLYQVSKDKINRLFYKT